MAGDWRMHLDSHWLLQLVRLVWLELLCAIIAEHKQSSRGPIVKTCFSLCVRARPILTAD